MRNFWQLCSAFQKTLEKVASVNQFWSVVSVACGKERRKNQFSDRDFTEEAYSVGVIPVISLNCLEK